VKTVATNKLGDALAQGGTTFSGDDDPELIRAAVPFSLKLMESLMATTPTHQGLLLATASGFTQYSYAFVQQDADELEDKDVAAATHLRERARHLYLRARNYGLRGLDVKHPGFETALRANPAEAVQRAQPADVPLLYWTAASWAAAISILKDNASLIADLPMVEAMIDRALELDEQFDHGTLHTFLITYDMSRQTGTGDPEASARRHFARAVELSGGHMAGPYVSLADAVSLTKQDRTEFEALLKQALAIDPDAKPAWRLTNLVMQRRARWLLGRTNQLFVD
jgi:predicted anti-sigma-YlaC factor YlaD